MILAVLGTIDYAVRAQMTYSSIREMIEEMNNFQRPQQEEDIKLLGIFRILYVLQKLNTGLNILGSVISSSLLYGVINEKQHFLNLSLFFIPFDVVMRTLIMILLLLLKMPGVDPITTTVAHVITVLILNMTWLLTILYKQQIQRQTEKEKTM